MSFEIKDFYNQGAQVVTKGYAKGGSDSKRKFKAGKKVVVPGRDIGYEPKPNSKLAEGASYDELEHAGQRHLLLKGGHVYDVKVGDELHVISAEEGHLSLPLPKDVEVEVDEHDDTVALTGDLADLTALDEKVEKIVVSDGFAEQYGVEAGERQADELLAELVEKGALVAGDDGKLAVPLDDEDADGDDASDEEE